MAKLTGERRLALLEKAAENTVVYAVQGSGYFPFDMLRYDSAYPADSESAAKLLISRPRTETRVVRLRSLKNPTVGRWLSFGWEVIKVYGV